MKYQLVLQYPGKTIEDFEKVMELEEQLGEILGASCEVDGHDFGSGQMNIFVLTDDPNKAFAAIRTSRGADRLLEKLNAAYRQVTGKDYTILWPPTASKFHVT